jgi:hypothetical protein
MRQDSIALWAQEEFGHAELGDARRTARLVAMGSQVARRPGGTVTKVFEDAAAREGAFRFLESDQFSSSDVQAAMRVATAKRAAAHRFVYVPIDQSAQQITDGSRQTFGPLSRKDMGTGAQAMSALVVSPHGVPLGLAGLAIWTRGEARSTVKQDYRPVSERETQFWLDAMSQATTALAEHAPDTLPWFQLDRGGDAAHVLWHAASLGVGFTVRASYDRRIRTGRGRRYLYAAMASAPVLGHYTLPIRARPNRPARIARIEVRACPVTLDLALGPRGRPPMAGLRLWAVEAREVDTDGVSEPVLWRLLTNRAVETFSDAREVVEGYTMRWRVEDFHLAWKSGTCHVEDSRLRDLEHFARWATILATVAVRAQRLKMLSRETPDVPAATEFSRDEIDAVIILRKPKGVALGAEPTLGQVVRWIADLGGYTGKSSGGPPGVRILSRALPEVLAAAAALAAVRAQSG